MRRKILLICSAIIFIIALYFYLTEEGIFYTYTNRRALNFQSTIITSPGLALIGIVVFVMGITTPKSIKYSDEGYKHHEKERKQKQKEQFDNFKKEKV